MFQTPHTLRRVTTADAAKIEDLLNLTVEGLIPVALALDHGIRVTRIGPGDYSVETAPDIARGYTVCEHR